VRLTVRHRILLFTPLGVLLGGWLVLPAMLGLLSTFTSYSPGVVTVRFTGLANVAAVLRDREFATAVRNIAFFTVLAVPLELGIGFGLAYLLRRPMRGRGVWRVALLLPWLISPIGSGVMWHFLFSSATGFIDFGLGWLGLPSLSSPIATAPLALPTVVAVEVWRVAPFVAFLLLPALSSIPAERWEDAELDGLSLARRIWDVALPPIRPLVLAITMLLIGLALGTFDSVLILTGGGPGTATVMPALYSYNHAFGVSNWSVGATSAWLIAIGVIGVGIVYLRLARVRT
jgi:ABC-type sugar transport system permease subunit